MKNWDGEKIFIWTCIISVCLSIGSCTGVTIYKEWKNVLYGEVK